MTTEKIVTHEDRADLLDLRCMVEDFDSVPAQRQTALLDRLIAAAEADQPPLPEGWVLWETPDREAHRVVWHSNGCLYVYSNRTVTIGDFQVVRDRLTPLRPTVTEADVEKAARELAIRQEKDDEAGALAVEAERNDYRLDVRAAPAVLGIEVSES